MSFTYINTVFRCASPLTINGSIATQQLFIYDVKKNMSMNKFVEEAFIKSHEFILNKPSVLYSKLLIKNVEILINGKSLKKTSKVKDHVRDQSNGTGQCDICISTIIACVKCTMVDKNILYCLVPINSLVCDVIKLLKPFTKEKSFYDVNNKVITSTNKILDIAQNGNYYELKYNDTTPISNTDSDDGYIYMIKPREFIKTKEEIYKIGKTERNILIRTSEYPKNSKLITCITVPKNKVSDIENSLIKSFTIKFKQRTDIGTEYFEGDRLSMLKEIMNTIIQ